MGMENEKRSQLQVLLEFFIQCRNSHGRHGHGNALFFFLEREKKIVRGNN
ncbi:hypothetical protein LguiA_015985 [Lonicera macranthoides]